MVIYITTNLINGKKYIGKDSKNNPSYLGSGKYLMQAIKKYGRGNFKKEILECCDSIEALNNAELRWLKKYNCVKDPNYYNVMDSITPCRAGRPLSEDHKKKLSEVQKGKTHSIETKKRLSELRAGIKRGPYKDEHRKAISESLKGRVASLETRKKIADSKKGVPNIHSRKKIIKVDSKSGEVLERYEMISDVKKDGFSTYAVQNCLSGISKTSGKFIWKYDS